jgi:hypothetical protein
MSTHLSITARTPTCELAKPTSSRPHSPIYILDEDILLEIFKFCRLDIKDEDEDKNFRIARRWDRQRWWYKLAQVSWAWRCVILASPFQLDLHLLCTYGVPVAEMLVHSPPLPLILFYEGDHEMTTEDENNALLALSHRDRVRRISFHMPAPNLGKFVAAMDEEFPVLERMCVGSRLEDSKRLVFPVTFQASNLRHVWTASVGYPLLTNTPALVNLELIDIPSSAYFPPSHILNLVALMPQLETFTIHFLSPLPNRDVERQLLNTPITTRHLLHLHLLSFRGVSDYFEVLVSRIRVPALTVLNVQFFNQLIFTVPHLFQFTQASANFRDRDRACAVELTFDKDFVGLMVGPDLSLWGHPLRLRITCRRLDWQVSSVVQILGALLPMLSLVEKLTLSYVDENESSEWLNGVDRTQWRELFRPFVIVKTLCVPTSFDGGLARALCSEGGESPMELLPDLLELQYSGGRRTGNAFSPFIIEREAAGHPVRLVRYLFPHSSRPHQRFSIRAQPQLRGPLSGYLEASRPSAQIAVRPVHQSGVAG